MAELRTEEEQVEALKRWWKENGISLIAGVAIAAAGVFGWNAWQNYQENQASAASARYQHLINLTAGSQLDDASIAEARELVVEITDNHGKTLYADLARLIDARLAVAQESPAEARAALEAVIDASGRDYVKGLARLRLARLQVADGDAEAALSTLEAGVPEALAAQRAEVRGDAYHALGRESDAGAAWREALDLAEARDQPLYGVQLKLDNLGIDHQGLDS
ncbi:tetratricopeptide repeat protein [Halomonas sp. A11-A]|uniref:YfgM family protein n=1 Tax=Halomonas sp. A11-A TaxID=2183985 RepID=UPI000D718F21|nr:tetratricopeptide repeat protein [Halomonas sp. A11-A]PWV81576.1 putative negative regulator of RcsB-dependent stress response [Halomonas sp. A11-A]